MNLKHHLAAVFDDDLHTRKWHNLADYLIIGMILLSTAEVFLSTFDVAPELRRVLFWVDIATLIFFTIEVSLRIWVAPVINPKYKGWRGRLRYCFSFHGFIDMVSTYPYYLQWFVPFPIAWIKVLRMSRVARLFRISRYMKSWRLLTDSIAEKRRELLISMQFLVIITFILSLILFFFEHDAQPDVYDNGFSTVAWSFAQYIGDPGGFGDTPPITLAGKIIACIVGLLGIAIVAVPAGILGAGFTEAIEKENDKERLATNREKLALSFERKLDRPTGYRAVLPFRAIVEIQARQNMTADDIINAVAESDGYRLVNLAATIPTEQNPTDRLAVEHFPHNTAYGVLVDRGSAVTIVSPSSYCDPCTGFFAYYMAKIGGFNYISREYGPLAPMHSFYNISDDTLETDPAAREYFMDLARLASRPGAWTINYLISSGALEPDYPTQFHFGTGNAGGDESIGALVIDKAAFARFYEDFSAIMHSEYGLETDCGRYSSYTNKNLIMYRLPATTGGHIVMRVAWRVALWSHRRLEVARSMALCINRDLLGIDRNPDDTDMRSQGFGFQL